MTKNITLAAMAFVLLSGSALAMPKSRDGFNPKMLREDTKIRTQHRQQLPIQRDVTLTDIIYNAEGERVNYLKSVEEFMMYKMQDDDFASHIVWGEDGEVYFYNIISMYNSGTYVKGTLQGSSITVPMNQTVFYDEYEGYGLNLAVFKTVYYDENYQPVEDPAVAYDFDMVLAEDIEAVIYNLADDGTLSLQLPDYEENDLIPGYFLGYYYTDYEEAGYLTDYILDSSQVYTPIASDIVTMPEGVEIETFFYINPDTLQGSIIEVAKDGQNLYFRGLSSEIPEGVFMAQILEDDPTIAFVPQMQTVGITSDGYYYLYTAALYVNPDYDENDENSPYYVMAPDLMGCYFDIHYSEDGTTIESIHTLMNNPYFALNISSNKVNPAEIFGEITLSSADSFDGTPSNPTDLFYDTSLVEVLGFNNFGFNLTNISTEGGVLDADNLYYSIYIDGEVMTFEQTEGPDLKGSIKTLYPGIEGSIKYIPYTFQNDWDIYVRPDQPIQIGLYIDSPSTVGVQAFYSSEKMQTQSALVTLDIVTGTVTTTNDASGVDNMMDTHEVSTLYYDLNGNPVKNPINGIFIEKVILSDGSVIVKKVAIK